MSEYLVDALNNNLVQARVLTNTNAAPVMLNLAKNSDAIIHLTANESVLYNNIVVSDTDSPLYNTEILNSFIANKILSDSTVTPLPPTIKYSGLTGASHILDGNTISKTVSSSVNQNLYEIASYVMDITNTRVKCIVYRSDIGIAYSVNGGKTILPAPQDGLLYPNEITSVAILAYDSPITLDGTPTIYIGTLREGLKKFTIGTSAWVLDTTEFDFSNNGIISGDIYARSFYFKQTVKISGYIEDIDGYKYDSMAGNFEPCYVVNIANYPIGNGAPMLVYARTTEVDLDGNSTLAYKYLTRNLYSTCFYYSNNTIYNVYKQEIEELPALLNWTVIDTFASLTTASSSNFILESEDPDFTFSKLPAIIDVNKNISFSIGTTVISSYTKLLAVTVESSGKYYIKLYKLENSPKIVINNIVTQERNMKISCYNDISENILIESKNFTGLSCCELPQNGIFITETDKIWRYWNSSWTLDSNGYFIPWISSNDSQNNLNFKLTIDGNLITTPDTPFSYVEGLLGFSLLRSTDLSYYGIVATDLGYIKVNFVYSNGNILPTASQPREFLKSVFSSRPEDIQNIHELNTVVSCGLTNTVKITYKIAKNQFSKALRYKSIIPILSSNLADISLQDIQVSDYKNYYLSNSNSRFHNRSYLTNLSTANIEQYYSDFLNSNEIKVFLTFPTLPSYVSGYDFTFIQVSPSSDIETIAESDKLYMYLNQSTKYNKFKILIRATEQLSNLFNDAILESQIEVPYTIQSIG